MIFTGLSLKQIKTLQSCKYLEYCKVFKNNYFEVHLPAAASAGSLCHQIINCFAELLLKCNQQIRIQELRRNICYVTI